MMSQLLQFAQGHSPLIAGMFLLPWTLAPGVISPIAGSMADRYGNRVFMGVGLLLQAAGLSLLGVVAAALLPRRRPDAESALAEPATG